jgi:hypothetical protein
MKRIVDLYTVNRREKLLALLVTIAIWIGVVASREEPLNFTVKVSFMAGPDHLVTAIRTPVEVHVQARGSVFAKAQVQTNDLDVLIDVTQRDPGRAVYFLDERDIPLSRYLKIEQILPREIGFTISKKMTRTVGVEATLDGQPKKGYKIAAVKRLPLTVSVSGPEEIIGQLESVPTERIDISGISSNIQRAVRIATGVPGVAPVGDGAVAVTVVIERDIREIELSHVPIAVDGAAASDIIPPYIGVRVKGPAELVEKIAATGLTAFVGSLPARLYVVDRYYFKDIPPGVEILDMEKIKQITVRKKEP